MRLMGCGLIPWCKGWLLLVPINCREFFQHCWVGGGGEESALPSAMTMLTPFE